MQNLIFKSPNFKIFIGFAAVLFYPSLLVAEEYKVSLDYKVYIGGIHTANIEYVSEINPKNYIVNLQLKTSKFVRLFLPAEISLFSRGSVIAGRHVVTTGGTDSNWRGKKYKIRLKYSSLSAAPSVKVTGSLDEKPVSSVTEVMKVKTTEVTGAIQHFVNSVTSYETCDSNVRVYDGKRAFLASIKKGTEVNIRRTDYSIYQGTALKCHFSFKKLGGFRVDNDDDDKPTYDPIYVWFGKPFKHVLSVPVRVEFETPTGWLIAHLTRALMENRRKNIPKVNAN